MERAGEEGHRVVEYLKASHNSRIKAEMLEDGKYRNPSELDSDELIK